MSKIIFKTAEGGVAILMPTTEALQQYTLQEIAEKDVPAGTPYKIVADEDVPTDRTFRDAWEVDEATLTDGVGGEYDLFITDPQHPQYVEPEQEDLT